MTELTFQKPSLFFLLLLIPLCIFIYLRFLRKRQPAVTISTLSAAISSGNKVFNPHHLFFLLRMLAVFFLIAALAKPVSNHRESYVLPAADIDIVLVLDVSGSMLIEDIKPNRLEALKEVITNFITLRSQDRIGLVLYAGESEVWSPLTRDSRFLLRQINAIDNKLMADGTAIGVGLASAVNLVKGSKAKNKIIILLTDGENNAGFVHPLSASLIAAKYKAKVYSIGFGTTGKAPLPVTDFDGRKTYQYIDVKLDEPLLSKIAVQTGGRYFRAADRKSLQYIYEQINRLEKTKEVIHYRSVARPQYHIFAGLASLFVLLEIVLALTLFRMFNA